MAYSTLLFDIDDTILNFDLSEKQALNKLFANLNKPLTPEIMAYYQQLNQHLWQQYERGEISRQELLDTRFTLLFKHFGEDLNGKLIEKTYRNYLAEGHRSHSRS
ncbi:YjjG family noncanonical pyrimidine nucleotidase [Lentilactobacillus parafarraginis]|uniref:HAD family hydrolase n=1 Tax=Lentilactobacillus parafarraginis TaxID=390842 RepID=UPI000302A80A|nr:HAD family hydrolase [Lentilactobacillus parafarraginis]